MIIREWRGRASLANAEAYPAHFRRNVLPEIARLPGFAGAELCKRRSGDTIEFLVLTRWRDFGAIEGFAGREIDKAVVEPGAIAALIDFDARVQHYEVIEDDDLPCRSAGPAG
ncbi:MAG: antibiotic biosynthesis monooxygenase [Roseiarcus sp.]